MIYDVVKIAMIFQSVKNFPLIATNLRLIGGQANAIAKISFTCTEVHRSVNSNSNFSEKKNTDCKVNFVIVLFFNTIKKQAIP